MFSWSTLRSKTFWLGMVCVGIGWYLEFNGSNGTGLIIAGAGLIFGRDAVQKLIDKR